MRGRVVAVLLSLLVLAGCGGPAAHASHPSTPAPSDAASATAKGATDLRLTAQVEAELVAAAARLVDLPADAFDGLQPGSTYYAYDASTHTYWAGGALVPRSGSTPAGIAIQDGGSYVLFRRSAGGAWQAYDVGLAGVGGTACPVQVPSDVLQLWGWPPGTCQPPRG